MKFFYVTFFRGGRKGSSLWGTLEKKFKYLRPAASKVIILRLRHYQASHVAIYIAPKL